MLLQLFVASKESLPVVWMVWSNEENQTRKQMHKGACDDQIFAAMNIC